jgi:hypothetical protein
MLTNFIHIRHSRCIFIGILLTWLCTTGVAVAGKEQIPIKTDIGFGVSQYTIFNAYSDKNATVYGTELSITGVIDKETIRKYKNKIPKKYRKASSKLNEVSITHIAIPKTLYIHPSDGDHTAFGATWGFVPSLTADFKYFKAGLSAGVIGTYLYYHDSERDETVNFIRPGVRAAFNFQIPMFDNSFIFEAGMKQDAYIPQQMFGADSAWHFSGAYVMLHFRIPTTIEAKL